MKVLVTGATGYIGGRLVPELLEKGHEVRAAGRSLKRLKSWPWASHPKVELIELTIDDFASTKAALEGCRAAYYLIHSMRRDVKDFAQADREAARLFARAAEAAHLKRILYLSGLGGSEEALSEHLASRREVENIFRKSSVPTTVFRAAMIIGSGSASFEILRYLVEHLPVMITPKWVRTQVQPLSIRNALTYLVEALEVPETVGQTFDIGGPGITTYEELMRIYADVVHLPPRKIVRIGLLTPHLSSYWIGLVTPLPAKIGILLTEGLRNSVICEETRIRQLIPQKLLTYRESIERAVATGKNEKVHPAEEAGPGDPKWAGGMVLIKTQALHIPLNASFVWKKLIEKGLAPAWQLRSVDPEERVTLVAASKLPGKAKLEIHLTPLSDNETKIELTYTFYPLGLSGLLYRTFIAPSAFSKVKSIVLKWRR